MGAIRRDRNVNNLRMIVLKNVMRERRARLVMGVVGTKHFFAIPSSRIHSLIVMAHGRSIFVAC